MLSAIDANIGTLTAGILRVTDGRHDFGNLSARSLFYVRLCRLIGFFKVGSA